MKIDIHKVASKAGVSIATVSRALNGSTLVKSNTKEKILKIVDELNYIPNPIARSLSKKSTETIGVVLPDLVGEFFMDFIHSIDEEAYKQNWHVLISSSHSQRNIIETLIELMGSGRVDGVILMAPLIQNEVSEIIQKSKTPVVLINTCGDFKKIDQIKINNFQGAFNIVEHFIKVHKYKKIGIINGPKGNCDAEERLAGYLNALKKYKVRRDDSLIMNGDFDPESGVLGFTTLMNQKVKPEAIFAANDMMAVGAYEAAKELGYKIPEDIAIAGFDDIYLSRFLNPRLTTIHVPITDLGSKAVKYLLNRINKKERNGKVHFEVLPIELVIGGSCGCKNN
jgi:DNA-binding LacI/PurR family transcriptional regulator